MDFELQQRRDESDFEYKLRLIRAKDRHEVDLDWSEIAGLLNDNVSADHLRKMAKGIMEYDNYLNEQKFGDRTILSISDLHIPFQLDVRTLEKYRGKIDILQINGDVVDNQALSKFTKAYRESPMKEIVTAREYLIDLISLIKPKSVYITYGNHDIRFEKYLAKNLDNDLVALMPRTSLDLIVNYGFRYYDKESRAETWYEPLINVFSDIHIIFEDNWFVQLGDAIFCHPSAFSSGILKTAEKAMLWFRNEGYDFRTLVMAHTHRSGMYTIGKTTIFEQGAFCDTDRNNYINGKLLNSQKQGFLLLKQDEAGTTIGHDLVVLN